MPRNRRRFPVVSCGVLGLLALVALGLRAACSRRDNFAGDWSAPPLNVGQYEVVRVLAPDALLLRRDGRIVRVRVLGIECDPRPAIDKDGIAWWEARLADGVCRLEFDKRRIDPDGSYLAYVYSGDALLNVELVRAGLARARPKPDDSPALERQISRAEDEAKTAERALWNSGSSRQRN